MRRQRALAWLLAGVVVALCAWFYLRANDPPAASAPVAHEASDAAETRPTRTSADVPALGAPSPGTELPPDDAPLSMIAGSLQARADAGDRKAACRLGVELLRCQQTALMASSDQWTNLLPPVDDGGDPVQAAQRRAYEQQTEQCRLLPENLRTQGVRYLTQAARAGEPEAMLRYATGEHFPLDMRGTFNDPQFDTWRREAPGMLHRAFRAGSPEAVLMLHSAYIDDGSPLSALVENDAGKAAALWVMMARMHGWRDSTAVPGADAAALIRARAQAETWHQDLFGGKRYRNRSMLQPAYRPRPDGSPHAFCRDPAP